MNGHDQVNHQFSAFVLHSVALPLLLLFRSYRIIFISTSLDCGELAGQCLNPFLYFRKNAKLGIFYFVCEGEMETGKEMGKDLREGARSDWNNPDLAHEQRLCAATDAYGGLVVWKALEEKKKGIVRSLGSLGGTEHILIPYK